jgi:cytochrome c556
MKRLALVVVAVAAFGAGALAQGDAITQRKDAMKAVGGATGGIGRMLRGEEAFDLAKAHAALNLYSRTAKAAPAMFPAGSGAGDTRALPAVFSEMDKFKGLFDNWDKLSTAALTSIKDEASFKAEMPKVLAACGACHTPYRKPQ